MNRLSPLVSPRFVRSVVGLVLPSALGLALLAGVGCGGPSEDLPPLEPLPSLPLDSVEPVVREQLSDARAALDDADERLELAAAWGELGEVLHAYALQAPARIAYTNAATLDPGAFAWPYLRGVVAQDDGDFDAARTQLERAVELQPLSAPARLRLAEVLLAVGDAPAAAQQAEAARDAISADSYTAAIDYAAGRAAAQAGDSERAVELLQAAAEAAPEAGAVRHALGESLRRLGRDDEAGAELAASGAAPPPISDPLLERVQDLAVSAGAALRRSNQALVAGDFERAEESLRRGLAVLDDTVGAEAPEALELHLNLAAVLLRREQPDEALVALERTHELFPDAARVHHDLGTVQRALGDDAAAVDAFRRALELEPDRADTHFNLANALAALERWTDAEPTLERVLELRPDDDRARYLLAIAMVQTGRTEAGEERLRGLLADEPAHRPALRGLVEILEQTGRRADAIALYDAALDVEQPPAERDALLEEAARLAWKLGRRQRALGFWRQRVQLDPTSSTAATALANALQLSGQRDAARTEFARAVELDPDNATAWLSEISLWILEGDFAAARERADAALALHPDDAALAHTAARLLATAPDAAVRDADRALDLARLAYGVEPSLEHAETLAMAFANYGRFEEAIRIQRRLVQQAQLQNRRGDLGRLVATLRSFENRQPVRAKARP
ncbi:MAG: tetratricopeptide repeat protein [Acidobacteriota bacterium]